MKKPLFFLLLVASTYGFMSRLKPFRSNLAVYQSAPAIQNNFIQVFDEIDTLGTALCNEFVEKAKEYIKESGNFYAAIPGGSVLKLLSGLLPLKDEIDWSKVHIFYVNHKCVPHDDPTATHFKAEKIFGNELNVKLYPLSVSGENLTKGHNTDAHLYEKKVKETVPGANGLPVFDYMLLGVGKDGHIGSLYPDRKEVTMTDLWVLPVDKKTPSSVTLSLPVMNNAKEIRVVMTGADKAQAAYLGFCKLKTPIDFPVCGVGIDSSGDSLGNIIWMMDEACAAELKRNNIC